MWKKAVSMGFVAMLMMTLFTGVTGDMAAPTVDYSGYNTAQADWVLIAAALHDEAGFFNDPDYQEAIALHDYFASIGFDEEHIILLVDFDLANPIVDGPATKGDIYHALDFLATVTTPDSFVFVGILDLGHENMQGYYVELNDEPLYDHELDAKLDMLQYEDLVVDLVFRHAAGFFDYIAEDGRLCFGSTKDNKDLDVPFHISIGLQDMEADQEFGNGNGRIAFEEAYKYEKDRLRDIDDSFKPKKDDEISGKVYAPGV